MESEGVYTHDVRCLDGRASGVVGQYLGRRGGIHEANKGAGGIDRDVLCVWELGVVAAMPEEELLFNASVRVGEGTALRL